MAYINITIEVPDSVDPVLSDPQEIAELIVEVYNEEVVHIKSLFKPFFAATKVTFVSAEWLP